MIYLGRLAFFILIVNLFSNALNSQDLTFDVNYASNEVWWERILWVFFMVQS